jgi:hypothetical protein
MLKNIVFVLAFSFILSAPLLAVTVYDPATGRLYEVDDYGMSHLLYSPAQISRPSNESSFTVLDSQSGQLQEYNLDTSTGQASVFNYQSSSFKDYSLNTRGDQLRLTDYLSGRTLDYQLNTSPFGQNIFDYQTGSSSLVRSR